MTVLVATRYSEKNLRLRMLSESGSRISLGDHELQRGEQVWVWSVMNDEKLQVVLLSPARKRANSTGILNGALGGMLICLQKNKSGFGRDFLGSR